MKDQRELVLEKFSIQSGIHSLEEINKCPKCYRLILLDKSMFLHQADLSEHNWT